MIRLQMVEQAEPAAVSQSRQEHWEKIHRDRRPDEVSWHEPVPSASLELIERAGLGPHDAVIDVGGGVSHLADHLISRGFRNVTVLDIAPSSLDHAKRRLGAQAEQIHWLVADVLAHRFSNRFALWHDRAVFHFLTGSEERRTYVEQLVQYLAPRAHAIIATFAADGPTRCSGLPVVRYDPCDLAEELGDRFELVEHRHVNHHTPADELQRFNYCLFRRSAAP